MAHVRTNICASVYIKVWQMLQLGGTGVCSLTQASSYQKKLGRSGKKH